MSSVGSGSGSVDCRIAVLVHCRANWSEIIVNSDFTSNDTSLQSSGICKVLLALMRLSVDCSLRMDLSVSGCVTVVRYLVSYWDTCGSPVIKCLCFFVVFFFSSATKWKNCAIVPRGHWALNTMTTNCDPMRCSHADHTCYLDDD